MKGKNVLIVVGSTSDVPVMEEAAKVLGELKISYEMHVASAHRTPKKVDLLAEGAKDEGVKVIIAGAGFAAHLAGTIASRTILPVIGVPIDASTLGGGLDSLLSTVQMPFGVPVATVTVGKTGAKNAAILAAEIIAVADNQVAERLLEYRLKMTKKVEEADSKL